MPLQVNFQKSLLIIFASILALTLASIFIFLEILENEAKIAAGEAQRYESYLLADELRQSSDDLTRMARTYVVTGDPRFREYFEKIKAIRDGVEPRPLKYHSVYWDLVVATGSAPRVDAEAESLKALMEEAQFSEVELALLEETENSSNDLVKLETRAMNALEGLFEDSSGRYTVQGEPDPTLARGLLHGREYHRAKEKIMRPLEQFLDALDQRTSEETASHLSKQQRLNFVLVTTLGMSLLLVFISLTLMFLLSRKKEAQTTGRESLAEQLRARGYTASAQDQKKEGGRAMLARRLGAQHSDYPPISTQMKKGEADEETSLLFSFKEQLWDNWPVVMAAIVVAFVTLSLSWWFSQENHELSHRDVQEDLASDLNSTYNAVLDWLHWTRLEASLVAGQLSDSVSAEQLRQLQDDPSHPLHQSLRRLTVVDSEVFQHYILLDREGMVASSDLKDLTGTRLDLPESVREQVYAAPHYQVAHFPQGNESNILLSQSILLGAPLKDRSGAVFFTMPIEDAELTRILRRGYSGNFGEIYMVNAAGRFISENRWKKQMVETGWLETADSPVAGLRVSRDQEAPLIASVNSVIQGKSGRELNEYENYLGEKVVGAWEWDNTYRFGMINEARSEAAFAAYHSYTRQTLAGSAFTVALILALTLLSIWSRSKVTKVNDELKDTYDTIKQQNDKFARDLEIGSKVQMDMLPDAIAGEGFALDAFLKPAQTVSGDFYDFSLLDDGKKVYFCVGDVSGKGVPAALFMSVTKALLSRSLDQTRQTKDIMEKVNRELSSNNENCMFVTLAVAIADLATGELLLTNGGHNPPYIKKQSGELVCLEEIQGPLVGAFEDAAFGQQSVSMAPGDTLIFYTDGVTESQNLKEEFYGEERLEALLNKQEFPAPENMVKAIFRNVLRFIGRAQQFDDITLLAFQYSGAGKPSANS